MILNHVEIEETYAEGFRLYGSRILITADSIELAKVAAANVTGYATSTIHCDCEAGIDKVYDSTETPDHRPGVSVIFCIQKKEKVDEVLLNRIGQCVLTSASTACFDWFPEDVLNDKTFSVKTGYKLKFFGDGFEQKNELKWKGEFLPLWKIPMMDGYFTIQESFKVTKIIAGGNFLVFSNNTSEIITACQQAVTKMNDIEGIVLPFPGGFVRSPSKVGSKYKFLSASTNEILSPVLRDQIDNSNVPSTAQTGYEFIINGFTQKRVELAMKEGITSLCTNPSVVKISAGNYGGKLGKIIFDLKKILS
ncbi:MAG: formylmethanofuran--tetrahydromethanopterin N-formyltransferase [Candidatus Lokiarchaeota archaeon]|nr:formylmethanofuran--tetrahydromethanopterin N-formyltransferase [Candidatus Lokiarchaeota archaeon]